MITYEEFLKQNNIDKLEFLQIKHDPSEKDVLGVEAIIGGNLEEYIGIIENATELKTINISLTGDSEYYKSCKKLFKNLQDNVSIVTPDVVGKVNKDEFFQAEEIIEQVINEIDDNWTEKQKIAYVHYNIGKLVSYFPDFNFTGLYKENADNTRNSWKSLIEGKSVCNGTTRIAQNILSRVGVKTQELSTGGHSFLLAETEEGNIITDPTWDLKNTLFDRRPMYFGKTCEQLRKMDGLSKAHRLENEPENVLEISEEELREIYYSIGLTTEDRKFKLPILDKIIDLDKQEFDTTKDKIDTFLNMFVTDFPKEATHLSEARSMIEDCLCTLNIDSNKVKSRFVYQKTDEDYRNPILAYHMNFEGCENVIKMLNLEKMEFEEIGIEEFNKQYRQHEDNRLPSLGEGVRQNNQAIEKENQIESRE